MEDLRSLAHATRPRPRSAQAAPVSGSRFEHVLRRRLNTNNVELPMKVIPRHSTLYMAGEVGSAVYLVQRGWLKSCVPTVSGKVPLIDLHTRGELVGVPSFSGGRYSDSAVAMTESFVQVLPFEQLMAAVRRYDLLPAWTDFLLQRLHSQQQTISDFVTLDSEMRLASRLLRLSTRMTTEQDENAPVRLPARLTHEEIAAMVGTTRSRVGHFLTNFEKKGLIDRSGDAVVVVPARLRRFLAVVC